MVGMPPPIRWPQPLAPQQPQQLPLMSPSLPQATGFPPVAWPRPAPAPYAAGQLPGAAPVPFQLPRLPAPTLPPWRGPMPSPPLPMAFSGSAVASTAPKADVAAMPPAMYGTVATAASLPHGHAMQPRPAAASAPSALSMAAEAIARASASITATGAANTAATDLRGSHAAVFTSSDGSAVRFGAFDSEALAGGGDATTTTEQVARVLMALQSQTGSRPGFTFGELEAAVGFSVASNTALMVSLRSNHRVKVDLIAGRVAYRPKYSASDRYELLRLLHRRGRLSGEDVDGSGGGGSSPRDAASADEAAVPLPGFRLPELEDVYAGAATDITALTRTGGDVRVVAVADDGGSGSGAVAARAAPATGAALKSGAQQPTAAPSSAAVPLLELSGGVIRVRSIDTTKPDMVYYRDDPTE